jgi:hypothetical protein
MYIDYYFVKTTLERRHINLDVATGDYHFLSVVVKFLKSQI